VIDFLIACLLAWLIDCLNDWLIGERLDKWLNIFAHGSMLAGEVVIFATALQLVESPMEAVPLLQVHAFCMYFGSFGNVPIFSIIYTSSVIILYSFR
jgi:hypothetical protein